MMSNKNRTTLYVGVTNNIERRVMEHRAGFGSRFTRLYSLFELLYFEFIEDIECAIAREKQLKNWQKLWKWDLIEKENPELIDLASTWFPEEQILEFRKMKLELEELNKSCKSSNSHSETKFLQ